MVPGAGYFPLQTPTASSVAPPFLLKPHANGTRTLLTHLHFCVELYPDDAKDKVFLAIIKALLRQGNKPCTPKELSNLILKHKLTTLGGATPYATVSSRISQHFKRATDLNRSPLLGRRSMDNKNSRRLVYYVDQIGVPVKPGEDRTHSDSEESAGEGEGYAAFSAPLVSSPTSSENARSPHGPRARRRSSNDCRRSNDDVNGNASGSDSCSAPQRISTRVKRRRSPYSPPNEPHPMMHKRSRSDSISLSHPLFPGTSSASGGADNDDALERNHSETPRKGFQESGAAAGESDAAPTIAEVLASQAKQPVESSDDDGTDFHRAMMAPALPLIPFSEGGSEIGGSPHSPSHGQVGLSEPSTSPHHQLRPRTITDELVLQPMPSPSFPAMTLPSQLSPSQPPFLFGSTEVLPRAFFDPDLHPSDSELGDDSVGQPIMSYIMAPPPSTFDGSGHGVYSSEFHHPEDVSVSELDFLLGDGGDGGWGTLSSQPIVVPKRIVDVSEQFSQKDSKRRSLSTTPLAVITTSQCYEPVPLAVTSYRCNGDTLEVYEKVSYDPVSVRVSKIKAIPRLEMNIYQSHFDFSGRVISSSFSDNDEKRVGVRLEGFVRAKELFEFSQKVPPSSIPGPAAPNLTETRIKEEGEEEQAVVLWIAYMEEVKKRALDAKIVAESSIIRISSLASAHVIVTLRGSDVEGENGVPAECGGVWIPTPEAQKLATALGISDTLADLFSAGPDSNDSVETLPSASVLASSTLLSVPTGPAPLDLATAASISIPKQASEASLASAALEEEVRHDDFLVFEGLPEGIQEEGLAGDSGDDSQFLAKVNASELGPPQLPPVSIDPKTLQLIPPLKPLTSGAPLYLTNIDGVLCYIMWLVKGADGQFVGTPAKEIGNPFDNVSTGPTADLSASAVSSAIPVQQQQQDLAVPLLRRVDNNMVNATLLLHAGGLVTDRERSIVLSLERGRARCRKKGSALYGTWIPLTRARHLARTNSLQGKLGGFLGEAVCKSAFGIVDTPTPNPTSTGKHEAAKTKATSSTASNAQSASGSPSGPAGSAVNKAAMLGLSSLPGSGPRGMLAVRGKPRGRSAAGKQAVAATSALPAGRSLVGGRIGASVIPSGAESPSTSSPSSIITTPPTTSSVMAATQAAIAALSKLGGTGGIATATLESALAALAKGGPSDSKNILTNLPSASAANGGPTMPIPASILQALASVFKNGFTPNWKPGMPQAGGSSGNLAKPGTPSGKSANSVQLGSRETSANSSATSSPTHTAVPGVVARALAAAGAGRATGSIANPVSNKTHALAGLPNRAGPKSSFSSLPHSPAAPGAIRAAASALSPLSTTSPSSTLPAAGLRPSTLPVLTPATVPLLAIDEMDVDESTAVASTAAVATTLLASEDGIEVDSAAADASVVDTSEAPSDMVLVLDEEDYSADVISDDEENEQEEEGDSDDVQGTEEEEDEDEDDDDNPEDETFEDADDFEEGPRVGGGKIRPIVILAPAAPRSKGKAVSKKTRNGAATVAKKGKKNPPNRKPASSKGKPKPLNAPIKRPVATGGTLHKKTAGTEESSDIEIDVVDGDGVDDFR
ncbi:hypothetical protein HKX48_002456 [Thoreauomyces humboldtii]|nr:hypothetical protein HKX48_002456 [Thoreauomyces humboldtii]